MLLQKSFYGQISNNGLLLSSSMIKPLARAALMLVSLCQIRKAAESFTADMVKMDRRTKYVYSRLCSVWLHWPLKRTLITIGCFLKNKCGLQQTALLQFIKLKSDTFPRALLCISHCFSKPQWMQAGFYRLFFFTSAHRVISLSSRLWEDSVGISIFYFSYAPNIKKVFCLGFANRSTVFISVKSP